MNLEEENIRLKAQLENAKVWMRREISANDYNHSENVEEKIYSFFSPEALSHFPNNWVDNIVSAELVYKHLLEWEDIDGMWVILSYQKIIDEMIELYITRGFRKYVLKHSKNITHINDPLEKSLRLIIEKKHIFSLWRVHQILGIISSWKKTSWYVLEFSQYLKSRNFLEKSLLESAFLLQLKWLIDSHAVTDKRHSWTLSKKDTITARNLIIWDFTDKNCILQILAQTQSIDI
jgi:hypothetical protein